MTTWGQAFASAAPVYGSFRQGVPGLFGPQGYKTAVGAAVGAGVLGMGMVYAANRLQGAYPKTFGTLGGGMFGAVGGAALGTALSTKLGLPRSYAYGGLLGGAAVGSAAGYMLGRSYQQNTKTQSGIMMAELAGPSAVGGVIGFRGAGLKGAAAGAILGMPMGLAAYQGLKASNRRTMMQSNRGYRKGYY